MIYQQYEASYEKKMWVILERTPKQIWFRGMNPLYDGFYYLPGSVESPRFLGGTFHQVNRNPEPVFADAREELLIHMISRQQKIIADAEVEIDRLNGLREVPE